MIEVMHPRDRDTIRDSIDHVMESVRGSLDVAGQDLCRLRQRLQEITRTMEHTGTEEVAHSLYDEVWALKKVAEQVTGLLSQCGTDLVTCDECGQQHLSDERNVEFRFGECPRCGCNEGYVNLGSDNWFVCQHCQVRWVTGNVFSSYKYETEQEQQESWDTYGGFEVVEPTHCPHTIQRLRKRTPRVVLQESGYEMTVAETRTVLNRLFKEEPLVPTELELLGREIGHVWRRHHSAQIPRTVLQEWHRTAPTYQQVAEYGVDLVMVFRSWLDRVLAVPISVRVAEGFFTCPNLLNGFANVAVATLASDDTPF